MTVALSPSSSADERIVLRGISWETYESLLRDLDEQHFRLTYDRGTLEIMSPVPPRHAKSGKLIARLIEAYTLEMRIPLVGLSNTTWKKEALAKGLEADECYYIERAEWAAGRDELDLDVDPPPDLAVEVDISNSSLDKQAIYAALGVPELWRYEDDKLTIVTLNPRGEYAIAASSRNLPNLPPAIVEQFVRLRTSGKTDTQILAEFTDWARAQLRRGGG